MTHPRRKDSGTGERDRLGRRHRRPADGSCGSGCEVTGGRSRSLGCSARRQPVRARRARSPKTTESLRLKPIHCLAAISLLCLLLIQQGVLGAEPNKRGREIFRQLWVKCHGRNGEGVKGKYDDALRGDWPIEKLTRYIDKNMPDDAPDKCVGPDAEAVARYIYDAFYSREARLRNQPPRVELVRLTNRQYVNTVADLIKHFTGNDTTASGERGLQATYYSSRNFNRGSNVFERV